jgi:predicted secreted Zn-dependent protease
VINGSHIHESIATNPIMVSHELRRYETHSTACFITSATGTLSNYGTQPSARPTRPCIIP